MWLQDAFIWLGETGAGRFLAASTPAFAATESAHILFFGVLGGAFLALDLAALGLIFRKSDLLSLARSLFPIFLIALAGAAITGILLVAAGPMKYYTNPIFPLKLLILLAAITIHLAIYPGLTAFRDGDRAVLVRPLGLTLAALSLILWFGVAILGRWLGLI